MLYFVSYFLYMARGGSYAYELVSNWTIEDFIYVFWMLISLRRFHMLIWDFWEWCTLDMVCITWSPFNMFQYSAGDMEFKQNRFLSAEKQMVTANPDINTVSLFLTNHLTWHVIHKIEFNRSTAVSQLQYGRTNSEMLA